MINRLARSVVVGAAGLMLVTMDPAVAYANNGDDTSQPPQYAVGHFGTSSIRRPPCPDYRLTCDLSLVASGTTVGLPGSPTSYCHDPGYTLATTLNFNCYIRLHGTIPTRLLCKADERLFASINVTYRSSTGRQFDFIAIVSASSGQAMFDGSAIDTTVGVGLVHVAGALTDMCYSESQEQGAVFPEWGMKGKIKYTHIET